jgi:hypothetical protein
MKGNVINNGLKLKPEAWRKVLKAAGCVRWKGAHFFAGICLDTFGSLSRNPNICAGRTDFVRPIRTVFKIALKKISSPFLANSCARGSSKRFQQT